jgi:hypothetical protein
MTALLAPEQARPVPDRPASAPEHDRAGDRVGVLAHLDRGHARLRDLLEGLPGTPGPGPDEALRELYGELSSHVLTSRQVLWPLVHRSVPFATTLASQAAEEHRELAVLAAEDAGALTDQERQRVLRRAAEVVDNALRDEREVLLPALLAIADVRRLQRLGLVWDLVRRMAPTHPRPGSRPAPGGLLVSLPLTLLDRARHLVRGPRGPGSLLPGPGCTVTMALCPSC